MTQRQAIECVVMLGVVFCMFFASSAAMVPASAEEISHAIIWGAKVFLLVVATFVFFFALLTIICLLGKK